MVLAKELILYIIFSIFFYQIFNKYVSKYIIDKPVNRSSHNENIPTSGGIVFIFIHIIYVFLSKNYNLLVLIPVGILGFFDDVFNMSRLYRLIVQSINILLLCLLSVNFDIFASLNFPNFIILFLLLILGLTLINCINFMDGIDGLVASNIFLILLNYSLSNSLDLIAIPIVLFVFLFYNWSPAKLFMGDSGSTFLGIILFYVIISQNDLNSSLLIISTASALLMDSIVCIFRRLNNKENIFTPHKKHLYQRLNQNGMSHQKVAAIYAIGTLILIFFSQTNNLVLMSSLVFVLFLFGIYLEKNYAKPFNF